ncbi:MAG: type II toxin-antitoxin system death-on-curing family toxin [bacterium]
MNLEPEFLTVDDVLEIHRRQVGRYGGTEGLRDRGLLESAVAAPQAAFGGELLHSNLFEIAAAYAFHVAQNQPFVDGNKRTGLLCALGFLDINGITISEPSPELYDAMIGIAEKRLDKKGLAEILKNLAGAGDDRS